MPAVLGLRAKTGRAIAVVLSSKGEFLARREISLVDPKIGETAQPYHVVMEMPWNEAMIAVRPLADAIARVATAAVRALAREFDVRAVGIVGAPERKLEKIGNEHIRAHAAEGVLFRHALEVAAEKNALRHRAFAEKSLPGDFASRVQELGRAAGSPWRADEKMAAIAALLVTAARR
jgi:hypothetical protein